MYLNLVNTIKDTAHNLDIMISAHNNAKKPWLDKECKIEMRRLKLSLKN